MGAPRALVKAQTRKPPYPGSINALTHDPARSAKRGLWMNGPSKFFGQNKKRGAFANPVQRA